MPDNAEPAQRKPNAPEIGGGAAAQTGPTNVAPTRPRRTPPDSAGGRQSKRHPIQEEELPPDSLTTKKIRLDQARALATTRRKRISEFAVGGLVAALPGAVSSAMEAYAKGALPSVGHIVEIVLAIMFGTGVLVSIFRFDEPVARDVLEDVFPDAAKEIGIAWRLGRVCRRIKSDLLGQ